MVTNGSIKNINTKRLRIAFLVNDFPAFSETFILDKITVLLDLGHDVDIYALNHYEGPEHSEVKRYKLIERTHFLKKPATKRGRIWMALLQVFSETIRHPVALLSSISGGSYRAELLTGLHMLKVLESLNKNGNYYDIIHCHYGTIGRQFLLLKRAFRTKFIVSFYGHDLFCFGDRARKAYRALFRMADLVTANSKYTERCLIALGCHNDKIIRLHDVIDFNKYSFKVKTIEPGSTIKVLTVARLHESKGLEYSIRAIAKLASIYPIKYEIVGEGPERPHLEDLISKLDLSGVVFLTGALERKEVVERMHDSHIFILPSVTTRNGLQESGGGAAREAQACGMPVVASNIGGIPEGVEDGKSGFLVPECDVDALAEKVEFLVNHPEIWPEMGRAGRKIVKERFDINEMKIKLTQIYYDMLNKRM
jgi:colanic acid/amylovoran biosynthesis glycosyltransferase